MGRGERALVLVIHRAVLFQELRLAVAHVVGVRESEVDQEWFAVLHLGAVVEVVQDLLAVPGAACFVSAAPPGGVVANGEEGVGGLVAVAPLAGTHGRVAGPVKDGGHGVLREIRWHELRVGDVGVVEAPGFVGDVPERAPRHDHMAGRGADPTHPRTHVVRAVEDHATLSEFADVRGVEGGLGIVDLQVVWRLVVRDDEEEVGPLCRRGRRREGGCKNEEVDEDETIHGKLEEIGDRYLAPLFFFRRLGLSCLGGRSISAWGWFQRR